MPFLELRAISRRLGRAQLLRDVSLSIHPGEVVGVIGDNGAGKSSLVDIIAGTARPSAGEIRLHGTPVPRWNVALARASGIETVFQEQALAPQQTIVRNIFMGRERTGVFGFLRPHEELRHARTLLDEIGFPPELSPHAIVGELSGGERQGVALARAMSQGCQLLVLDEPTSALSLRETDRVMRFLHGVRRTGCAILLVGHNMRQVAEIADRIIVLDRGRVALETSRSAIDGAGQLERLLDEVVRTGAARRGLGLQG